MSRRHTLVVIGMVVGAGVAALTLIARLGAQTIPREGTQAIRPCRPPVAFIVTNDSVYYEVACRRGAVLRITTDSEMLP